VRAYFGTLGYPQPWVVPGQVGSRHRTDLDSAYYGTHPAARIFYRRKYHVALRAGARARSPTVAVIVKEQYRPPAAIYWNNSDDNIGCPNDWTFMIKNSPPRRMVVLGEVWYPVGAAPG